MPSAIALSKEAFEAKVERIPFSGCWLWLGGSGPNGYGRIGYGGRSGERRRDLAHRVSYGLFKSDPGSLFVLHRCDTPLCVNPEHLFLGTQTENIADMDRKGRRNTRKLTEEQAREVMLLKGKEAGPSVGARYGVSYGAVYAIWNGLTWRHLQ